MKDAPPIDPVALLEQLIDQGEDRIRRQCEIITQLQSTGGDVSGALDLLKAMLAVHATRLQRLVYYRERHSGIPPDARPVP